MRDVKKYLRLSQVSLLCSLLICCLIMPHVMLTNGGVSNFGNHVSTIVPYTVGFSLCIIFLSLAARSLSRLDDRFRPLALALLTLGLLDFLALVSTFPRRISWTYSDIHDYLGIVLVMYEFIFSVWISLKVKSYSAGCFLGIEFIGSLVALLTILKAFHFLFIGQAVGAIGFGLLLVGSFPNVIQSRLADKQ